MPIHYDTIEDGQIKNSHLLFSFLVRIVLFLYFIGGIFVKNIITSFHWLHLNNHTPLSKKPKSLRGVRHARRFRLRTDASPDTQCSRVLDTQLPRVIADCAIHNSLVMDGGSFV